MTYIYAKYNEFKSINPNDIDETIILNNLGSELYHYYYMAFKYNNQIITEQGLSSGNVPTPVGLQSIGLSIIDWANPVISPGIKLIVKFDIFDDIYLFRLVSKYFLL